MPFSSRTMRIEDWAKLRHFKPEEFPAPQKMGADFLSWLDDVREVAGVRMLISSSYRTPAHNAEVGGADDSAHTDTPCNAVDIRRDDKAILGWNHARMQIVSAAIRLGCTRIGVYADESIHLDRTEDQRPAPRLWIRV